MLPRLALAYGPVPETWKPREGDAGNVSACECCGTEYLDDFPNGGPLFSPCCRFALMRRAVRLAAPGDA